MKTQEDKKFLRLLSKQYPNIQAASSEIINLNAILNLPKGTEHYLSDLHGEHEAFEHIMRNASGVIKKKIDEQLGTSLTHAQRKSLATLIYYPEEKLRIVKQETENLDDWYKITLYRLVDICRIIASKYTRSKVRKALPKDFEYIMEELLHEHNDFNNKQQYYAGIIDTIIKTERADAFIIQLCYLIQRLVVDSLHIIGDIFDRGPGADIIMDTLMHYHCVDIQWGNHDAVWMGAAAGSEVCIATVLRNAAKYNNLRTIEEGYGINLRPLATFALEQYAQDECSRFLPASNYEDSEDKDLALVAKIHKAVAIIAFKLEGQMILRNPDFGMEQRLLLDKIDYAASEITIDGKQYPLLDSHFPTIDPEKPYQLSKEERDLIDRLKANFCHSERLQKHIKFLYSKGAMYTVFNGNLLYHGCIPVKENGEFLSLNVNGAKRAGKALLDYADNMMRQGYFLPETHPDKQKSLDFMYYLWCGKLSPLFGKDKMASFEGYFLGDKKLKTEVKNYYYQMLNDEKLADCILEEFGLNPEVSHIINGHVPVECKNGEKPIKAGGKLFIIDGGLSKAYQSKTGIAGYTLIFNSYGMLITSHQPFSSRVQAIAEEQDIHSTTVVVEKTMTRIKVADTDIGLELKEQIAELSELLEAYRNGSIAEDSKK